MKLVLGNGQTGQAAMACFKANRQAAMMIDTRKHSALPEKISVIDEVIISPGIDTEHPWVKQLQAASISVISDIQYFADHARAPIIAITGTNGKGTVTKLTAELLEAAGKTVEIGGNYGIAAMALLSKPVPDFYVIEVSSFQLEMTPNLRARVGCLLNITPDHLERHHTMEAYIQAKAQVFNGATFAVVDQAGRSLVPAGMSTRVFDETTQSLPALSASLRGDHNRLNVQAALAILASLNITADPTVLAHFQGLPHRCVEVGFSIS